jgi:hypothetical protein
MVSGALCHGATQYVFHRPQGLPDFIWWITSNRRKDGGYDFDTDVLNYLCAHPVAGITTNNPFLKQ